MDVCFETLLFITSLKKKDLSLCYVQSEFSCKDIYAPCACSGHRGQSRALDPVELMLQTI